MVVPLLHPVPYPLQMLWIGGPIFLFGTACIAVILRYRVTLHADAIEVRNVFRAGSRRLERKNIEAKYLYTGDYRRYVLYPRNDRQRSIAFDVVFREDAFFREWMAAIPDASDEFLARRRRTRSQG